MTRIELYDINHVNELYMTKLYMTRLELYMTKHYMAKLALYMINDLYDQASVLYDLPMKYIT